MVVRGGTAVLTVCYVKGLGDVMHGATGGSMIRAVVLPE